MNEKKILLCSVLVNIDQQKKVINNFCYVIQGQPGVGLVLVPPPINSTLGTQRRYGSIFYLKNTMDNTLSL